MTNLSLSRLKQAEQDTTNATKSENIVNSFHLSNLVMVHKRLGNYCLAMNKSLNMEMGSIPIIFRK